MPRILYDGEWFDAVPPLALYEAEFQAIVVDRAPDLFPGFITVPFTKVVQSDSGSKKPDLALIDRRYRFWWVVEVELGHHPFSTHVLPQVEILSQAHYGPDEAEHLASRNSHLAIDPLLDMMKGTQPRVLVAINTTPRARWVTELAKLDAIVTVVEVFRSGQNRSMIRLNGEYPELPADLVSVCRPEPAIPRFLRVDSPAALGVASQEAVLIRYQGALTEWIRVDASDTVWLNPAGASPIDVKKIYRLVLGEDGVLELRDQGNND